MKKLHYVLIFLMVICFQNVSIAQTTEVSQLSGPYLGQTPPGKTPVLFAPGIVSNNNQHSCVYFTLDGKEVYYSNFDKENPKIVGMKEVNGRWTGPFEVAEGLTPFLTPDGQKLFFSTSKINYKTRTADGWSASIELSEEINFQKRHDGACVTADGTLYFMSMRGNNNGIFKAKLENGEYSNPLKTNIQVEGNKILGYPFVAPDESYIIFNSWTDKVGYGMQDIFIMFKKGDGSWTKAINMGRKINTPNSESFPYVSPDGKYLFFNSNRPSILNAKRRGNFFGNIYWMDAGIIDEIKATVIK